MSYILFLLAYGLEEQGHKTVLQQGRGAPQWLCTSHYYKDAILLHRIVLIRNNIVIFPFKAIYGGLFFPLFLKESILKNIRLTIIILTALRFVSTAWSSFEILSSDLFLQLGEW